ncbi:MAG: DUF2065 domain-containing protein [Pseudomonadota bacterium]|jgi:uncharacterized protein|nr:DUF2065 domain-containing protein [Pseudomonadota bacterium]
MWDDLLAAVALVLVIEGMMPFLNPSGLRQALIRIANTPDGPLRMAGLVSMAAGALLLYFVRH